jgi:hypothetical protein
MVEHLYYEAPDNFCYTSDAWVCLGAGEYAA